MNEQYFELKELGKIMDKLMLVRINQSLKVFYILRRRIGNTTEIKNAIKGLRRLRKDIKKRLAYGEI